MASAIPISLDLSYALHEANFLGIFHYPDPPRIMVQVESTRSW